MNPKSSSHPGSATPTGGTAPAPAPSTATPPVVQPGVGNPSELLKIAAAFQAAADKFGSAHAKATRVHNTVFQDWQGAASREGERASKMAVGRAGYALDAMTKVFPAIRTFSRELEAAITQSQAATTPAQALSAQDAAAAARRKVEAAIVSVATVQWYTVPP